MMEIPSFKCTYPILREIYYIRNIKKYLFKFKMNNTLIIGISSDEISKKNHSFQIVAHLTA